MSNTDTRLAIPNEFLQHQKLVKKKSAKKCTLHQYQETTSIKRAIYTNTKNPQRQKKELSTPRKEQKRTKKRALSTKNKNSRSLTDHQQHFSTHLSAATTSPSVATVSLWLPALAVHCPRRQHLRGSSRRPHPSRPAAAPPVS